MNRRPGIFGGARDLIPALGVVLIAWLVVVIAAVELVSRLFH